MDAPRLSSRDLASKLDELCNAERRRFLFAVYGTGDEDRLRLKEVQRDLQIIPVRSELDLRRRLLELGDDDAAAFLLPWPGSLPLDLAGRFAKSGRIFRIGREARLKGLFGAVDLEPEAERSPLVDYLLLHHTGDRFAAGGRLTLDQLWSQYLAVAWGLEAPGGLALDALLGFAAADGRGGEFGRVMKERDAGAVRDALLSHLEQAVGVAGPVVWRAWERGQGQVPLELGILAQAVGSAEDGTVRTWWRMTAHGALAEATDDVLAQLGEASEAALRFVERRAGPQAARAIVTAADGRVALDEVKPALSASSRLPAAWRARLDALGEALSAGAAEPTREAVREARERLGSLSGHVFYGDPENRLVIERAEMAVRLLGWLATRADREIARSPTPYAEVECLSQWQVAEGGYVDWARRWARGGGEGPLSRGIEAVVAAADREREALDRAFARALPAYLEARRPATECVPIDQAVARVAKPFLAGEEERRLLVLLLDGMAWAQAAELLFGLGAETAAWGPLSWHGMSKNRIGSAAPYPAVLANMPTVTEVSRSAFFAGKAMPAGPSPNTQKDPERWEKHPVAKEYSPELEGPRLMLRGESQAGDGSASEPAKQLVADKSRRVVGVVVNVIDNFLKGDVAHRTKWTADSIGPLRDLLDKAREAGRAVLLCADHGHVPADRLVAAGPARKDGARWRTWESPEDPVAEWEVALPADKEGVWAPRGGHGVVLCADDAHQYGGVSHAGEHGGATLSEVVSPCVLIGCEDGLDTEHDAALGVRPVAAPAWWHFDVGGEGRAAAPLEVKKPRKRRASKPQLSLLPEERPAAEPEAARAPARAAQAEAAEESAGASAFSQSKVLKARTKTERQRKQVAMAVDFLLERGGMAGASAFASAIGEFSARVAGAVSKLQEVLNADGYEVLSFDRQAGQVRLDRGKLEMLFEVKVS